MLRLVALALTLLGLSCGVAPAQVFIVTTCGTVPASQATLTAGRPGMLFIDTTGVLCTSSSGGGGTPSLGVATGTAWSSATAGNTTQILYCANTSNQAYPAVVTQLDQTTTISAGAVTFEVSNDTAASDCSDGNWTTATVSLLLNQNTFAPLTNAYTLVASTNQPFLWTNTGYRALRLKLSTGITGSGTVTPYITRWPVVLTDPALQAPVTLIPGSTVAIDQTAPGTTNAVQTIASAVGGATLTSAIAPATPAGVNLKASAGTLYGLQCTTIQATPVYVKFYNSASAPTCGAGTPVGRWMCPAAATAANGAGSNVSLPPMGVAFSTGIGYCVDAAFADNATTAITANNTIVNIEWK